MFAGHLGAGLLLKRVDPKLGLGTLFFATMLLDFLLWVFVVIGWESIQVPATYHRMLDVRFRFTFSHSLVASLGWALLASFALGLQGIRPKAVIALAVFSHFLLDWLVHPPELPLAGPRSALLGLGLWDHPVAAWALETTVVFAGLTSYAKLGGSILRRAAVTAFTLVVTGLTLLGQASTSQPPPARVMALTSLATIIGVVAFGWRIERGTLPLKANSRDP